VGRMVGKRVYIDHLKHVPLFSECSRKDLEKLAAHSDVIELPAGRVIMHQGMPGSDAFVVLEGTVTVRRNGRKVVDLGPGAVVGELSLLDQGDRSASVECASTCSLLVLTRGEFLAAIDEVPALSRKLFASLAGRLRNLDGRSYV
jgi:CRP/FNR family transcriptional regulator, cyclic AMP receptor protein